MDVPLRIVSLSQSISISRYLSLAGILNSCYLLFTNRPLSACIAESGTICIEPGSLDSIDVHMLPRRAHSSNCQKYINTASLMAIVNNRGSCDESFMLELIDNYFFRIPYQKWYIRNSCGATQTLCRSVCRSICLTKRMVKAMLVLLDLAGSLQCPQISNKNIYKITKPILMKRSVINSLILRNIYIQILYIT